MSGAGSKRCGLIRSRRGKKSEPEPRDIMPTADGAERDEPRRTPHSAVKRFVAGFGKDRGVARRGKGDSSTDDGRESSKRAPKPAEDESLPKSSGGIAVEDEREGRGEGKSRTTRKPRRAFADAARVPFRAPSSGCRGSTSGGSSARFRP